MEDTGLCSSPKQYDDLSEEIIHFMLEQLTIMKMWVQLHLTAGKLILQLQLQQ